MSSANATLTDVTLRDGIQMESRLLSVEEKLLLLDKLTRCGFGRLEITSFVHPKWVPQFANSEEFCRRLPAKQGTQWMAFVPNTKGLERLLPFPIDWVAVFVASSETFNQKNVNQTITETLAELAKVKARAKAEGRFLRIYVSTVFGCPYESKMTEEKLDDVLGRVIDLAPDEIALSDTIGVGLPEEVEKVVSWCAARFPKERLALHLHNTYGLAVANALTGARLGVRLFDGSLGGLGGCPYAKGATGNVASEDLWYALSRRGQLPPLPVKALEEALRTFTQSLALTARSHIGEILSRGGAPFVG